MAEPGADVKAIGAGAFCFERKLSYAYATVKLPCYSKEQAMYLADTMWTERSNDEWDVFCVTCSTPEGRKVVKDYLTGNAAE